MTNLTGKQFGDLMVVAHAGKRNGHHHHWLCRCSCGATTYVRTYNLTAGKTKSCGCRRLRRGPQSANWRGGCYHEHGYNWVYHPEHPNAKQNGYVAEHRYVMATHLGRPLESSETVHHINGNRLDNRLANLELWSSSQPAGQRVADKLRWAVQIITQYSHHIKYA